MAIKPERMIIFRPDCRHIAECQRFQRIRSGVRNQAQGRVARLPPKNNVSMPDGRRIAVRPDEFMAPGRLNAGLRQLRLIMPGAGLL
jgi:hypothetical protein